MQHAALRRLPRDAIWAAALEAAGYRAPSNDDATLHRGEVSNWNLRARARREGGGGHIRFVLQNVRFLPVISVIVRH